MKRFWGTVLCLVFLVSFVTGAFAYEKVTLEEALLIARKNAGSVVIAQIELEEANVQFRQAQAAMIMQPSPVLMLQAQIGLDLAMQKYLMTLDNLALTVQTDFYNVLKLENLVDIATEAWESALRHQSIAIQKQGVGTATQLDVISATRNALNRQAMVSQGKHGLELATLKFRQTLGLPLDTPILPTRIAFEYQSIEIDLEADLSFGLDNREELKQLRAAVAIADEHVRLADNDYTPAITLELARLHARKLQAQLNMVKQLIELEIRQSYTAIHDAKERIEVLEKGLEEAQELYRLSELMYEAHMITGNELQDAGLAVLTARNDRVGAITDYNLAKARYFHSVTHALRDSRD